MSTRTRKTAQERAQETLDSANARVKRLAEMEARLTSELTGVRQPKAIDLAEGGDEDGGDE